MFSFWLNKNVFISVSKIHEIFLCVGNSFNGIKINFLLIWQSLIVYISAVLDRSMNDILESAFVSCLSVDLHKSESSLLPHIWQEKSKSD